MTDDTPIPVPAPVKLKPLAYFKLKARMLELALQERTLVEAKRTAFLEAGVAPGPYDFDDATHSLRRVG